MCHEFYIKMPLNFLSIMGHQNNHYFQLQKRLEKMPQGAPASDTLFKFLEILLTEEEAGLVSVLPTKPCTVDQVAKRWKKSTEETEQYLNNLADKGILIDIKQEDKRIFNLAPPMAGFIEFSLMRTDGKFDRKILSELYHKYINEESEFGLMLWGLDPAIDRCFVNEEAIPETYQSEVLDYERATNVIETASCITVGTCYCRHKMAHMGKPCPQHMPEDVCLTFNGAAKSLVKHGIAKRITQEEAMNILDRVRSLGLVQIGDNTQEGVSWICNCCGCCCEALVGYKRFGYTQNIKSNFYATFHQEDCIQCGICVERCPVDAITMEDDFPEIHLDRCIGCGVCTRFCAQEALVLKRREELNFTPKDSFERIILEAIQTNKLQNLLFDNYHSLSNRLLNRLLKFILNLKPVKQSLVEDQLQSRYIASMVKWYQKITKDEINGLNLEDYSHPELNSK